MQDKKRKILILGDAEKSPYHPLKRVLPGIRKALEPLGDVEASTEYLALDEEALQIYDFIVSYLDCFDRLEGFDERLSRYVRSGGKILALHNGIITLPGSELEGVYGGNFITHPPYCMLDYYLDGKKAFSLEEEPYMVDSADTENEVFLQFAYEGRYYDAGWYRDSGAGRTCYLALGHDERTTDTKEFQQLLRRCVKEFW